MGFSSSDDEESLSESESSLAFLAGVDAAAFPFAFVGAFFLGSESDEDSEDSSLELLSFFATALTFFFCCMNTKKVFKMNPCERQVQRTHSSIENVLGMSRNLLNGTSSGFSGLLVLLLWLFRLRDCAFGHWDEI